MKGNPVSESEKSGSRVIWIHLDDTGTVPTVVRKDESYLNWVM